MKPTLILDFDGTVVDDADRHWRVFMEVTELAVDKDSYWNLRRQGFTNAVVLNKLGSDKVFDINRFKQLIELKQYLTLDRLIPRAETMRRLSNLYEIILCSIRSNEVNLKWQLEQLDILDYLSKVVVISHLEFNRDQSKTSVLKIHLPNTIASTDCIVGDTEVDIRTGKELGIRTCAVESGIRNREYLLRLNPDVILEDLNQLVSTL